MSMFLLCNLFSDDTCQENLQNHQPVYEIYVSFEPFAFEVRESMDSGLLPEERQQRIERQQSWVNSHWSLEKGRSAKPNDNEP